MLHTDPYSELTTTFTPPRSISGKTSHSEILVVVQFPLSHLSLKSKEIDAELEPKHLVMMVVQALLVNPSLSWRIAESLRRRSSDSGATD